jgi:hypothetical protein
MGSDVDRGCGDVLRGERQLKYRTDDREQSGLIAEISGDAMRSDVDRGSGDVFRVDRQSSTNRNQITTRADKV